MSSAHVARREGGGPAEALSGAGVLRVGLVPDLADERWPSMDLVADMLLSHLKREHGGRLEATSLHPATVGSSAMHRVRWRPWHQAVRMVRRYWFYRCWIAARASTCDVFHVIDHSYAHLVHVLPPARTVVTCHDVDVFRPLFEPGPRDSRLPLWLVRHVLAGLRRAALVVCGSEATRRALVDASLVPASRLVVCPYGVHPACSPNPDPLADEAARRLLTPGGRVTIDLLNVGSTIPRKRIDLLLSVFAEVRSRVPSARLIRVGGDFTPRQRRLAERLGVASHIVVLPFLGRDTLSAVYRRAALVLLTSEREGFGLPVVEALACGTPVVATDLPVFREVGAEAITCCPLDEPGAWGQAVLALLTERRTMPERWAERVGRGLERAARFSWPAVARQMVPIYARVARDAEGREAAAGEGGPRVAQRRSSR